MLKVICHICNKKIKNSGTKPGVHAELIFNCNCFHPNFTSLYIGYIDSLKQISFYNFLFEINNKIYYIHSYSDPYQNHDYGPSTYVVYIQNPICEDSEKILDINIYLPIDENNMVESARKNLDKLLKLKGFI